MLCPFQFYDLSTSATEKCCYRPLDPLIEDHAAGKMTPDKLWLPAEFKHRKIRWLKAYNDNLEMTLLVTNDQCWMWKMVNGNLLPHSGRDLLTHFTLIRCDSTCLVRNESSWPIVLLNRMWFLLPPLERKLLTHFTWITCDYCCLVRSESFLPILLESDVILFPRAQWTFVVVFTIDLSCAARWDAFDGMTVVSILTHEWW